MYAGAVGQRDLAQRSRRCCYRDIRLLVSMRQLNCHFLLLIMCSIFHAHVHGRQSQGVWFLPTTCWPSNVTHTRSGPSCVTEGPAKATRWGRSHPYPRARQRMNSLPSSSWYQDPVLSTLQARRMSGQDRPIATRHGVLWNSRLLYGTSRGGERAVVQSRMIPADCQWRRRGMGGQVTHKRPIASRTSSSLGIKHCPYDFKQKAMGQLFT